MSFQRNLLNANNIGSYRGELQTARWPYYKYVIECVCRHQYDFVILFSFVEFDLCKPVAKTEITMYN